MMSTDLAPDAKENYILQYVDAAVSSSNRARAVIIVMITASVLAITPTWNAGGMWEEGEGWMESRIKIRTAALQLFDPSCPAPSEGEEDINNRAQDFLAKRGLKRFDPDHKQILIDEIKELNRIRDEQMTIIHTPFFGVVFDANDLGMFAGITFAIVLVWLRFSLARELRNLKLVFKEAERKGGESLHLCYDLLAMHQVLTVPPTQGQRFRPFWVSIALFLYLVPALAYGYLFKSDRQSEKIGNILNPYNTKLQWKVGVGLLSLIILLTIVCFLYHLMLDREWRLAYRKTLRSQDSGAKNSHELEAGSVKEHQPKGKSATTAVEPPRPQNRKQKRGRK